MVGSARRSSVRRAKEIARVAARHGFGHLVGATGRKLRPGPAPVAPGEPRAKRLRLMLEELGPTFVKFGQLLSTRPDVVPPDMLDELRELQDHVAPIPTADVLGVLEGELGRPVLEVFARFDETPLAAASIGQVHRATLPDGTAVVVKVQRPDAERQLSDDIVLLYRVARLARDRVRKLGFIDVVRLVDEFARTARQELDYRIEGRNAQVFARNFTGDEQVLVPEVVWPLTTSRVLTMTEVAGDALSHLDVSGWSPEERRRLAHQISATWMRMVFEHGFFHGDPHPANILVRSPDAISLVDFGMVGQLMPGDRAAAVRLFVDVIELDAEALPRRLRDLGVHYPREMEGEFREEIGAIVGRYHGATLDQIDGRNLLREIFGTVHRLGVVLPARWALLDKTVATLAGVGLELSPDFNVFETARPFARTLIQERFAPSNVLAWSRATAERLAFTAMDVPGQVGDLLEAARAGDLRVTVNDPGQRERSERGEAGRNRIVVMGAGAACLVSAALVAGLADSGPAVLGLALIGVPGLVLGFALIGWALVGVVRSGRW